MSTTTRRLTVLGGYLEVVDDTLRPTRDEAPQRRPKQHGTNYAKVSVEASPAEYRALVVDEYSKCGRGTLEVLNVHDFGGEVVFTSAHTAHNHGATRSDAAAFLQRAITRATVRCEALDLGKQVKLRLYGTSVSPL